VSLFLNATGYVRKAAKYGRQNGFMLAKCKNASPIGIVCKFVSKNPIYLTSLAATGAHVSELWFLYKTWKEPHELEILIQNFIKKINIINNFLNGIVNN